MTQQGLPVSKLISVSVTLTPSAAQGANLNSAMIVGDSSVIDVVTRYRSYESLAQVGTDFGTTAPEYYAADLYFSQSPQPTQLYIGRWAQSATPGQLWGGAVSNANQLYTAWTGITSGSFGITINSVPYAVTGLNFSAVTNLNGVASVVQTALQALLASTLCTWEAEQEDFVFQSPTTGAASTVSFLTPPTALGIATFSANPTNADTITFDGSSVEFVTSGATGLQVNIGGTLAVTLASLLTLLNSSADSNIVKMSYSVVGDVLYVLSKVTGTAGDSYTLAKSSTAITLSNLSGGDLTGGAGTDVSGMLAGLSTSSGAYVANGIAAETAVAAVTILDSQNTSWYALAFAAGTNNADYTDASALAVAAYIEGASNPHLNFVTTSEAAALTTNDSSSLGYQLHTLNYKRTSAQYSSTNAYAAVSSIALGVGVNFNASDSTINWQYQGQPGVVAENLTLAQSQALDANKYNYCANYQNGVAIITNGYVADGHYIDEIWNSDWFANRIQTDVFNLLYTAGTKVPQTDAGMHLIATTIKGSCDAAVNNGFLGPGVWNSAGFGQLVEGQFLPDGYYIYQPPIASQNQSARAARQSVAFQVAAKEAGAVNDVSVNVVVNQ